MSSVFVDDPTDTADDTHPGLDIPVDEPLLPAAMTVAMFWSRSESMADFTAALLASQDAWLSYRVLPPRLMFTEAILNWELRVRTCCSASIMSDVYAPSEGPENSEKT